MDNQPRPIPLEAWREIARIPEVNEGYGLFDSPPDEQVDVLRSCSYGVMFDFQTMCPGYVGPLYLVQSAAFVSGPLVLVRDSRTQRIELVDFDGESREDERDDDAAFLV